MQLSARLVGVWSRVHQHSVLQNYADPAGTMTTLAQDHTAGTMTTLLHCTTTTLLHCTTTTLHCALYNVITLHCALIHHCVLVHDHCARCTGTAWVLDEGRRGSSYMSRRCRTFSTGLWCSSSNMASAWSSSQSTTCAPAAARPHGEPQPYLRRGPVRVLTTADERQYIAPVAPSQSRRLQLCRCTERAFQLFRCQRESQSLQNESETRILVYTGARAGVQR